MKTAFRRNVTTLTILTPAALLAACSTSEGWHSSRPDKSNTYYSSVDPYGDGVGAGAGTRAADLQSGSAAPYELRVTDRNNPNWRDGPTRFDNENPSRDNSSSQYNTGISRNQDPADGTLNNQNIAKGTVQPADGSAHRSVDRWEANRAETTQSTRIDQSSESRSYQNDSRLARQYDANRPEGPTRYDNQNPSNDNSSSQYNTGISRNQDPREGTINNQNIAKGTANPDGSNQRWQQNQQLPPRPWDSNWSNSDQQIAARGMSDPQTNPSNSNSQFGQPGSQYANQPVNPQNRTWQSQTDQYQGQRMTSSNGVEPLGPQNNWGADRARTAEVSRDPAYRNTVWTQDSRQAAARDIADPATNPSNSHAQIGQTVPSDNVSAAGQPQAIASNATPDAKILSLLHYKNQKEIELGRLAAANGSTSAVREYGSMLVREHTAADAKVLAVAARTNTVLLSETETKSMIRAEKAAMGKNVEKAADDSRAMQDPVEELRNLSGTNFDRVFAQKIAKGHSKLASAIEKAKPEVRNESTRQLLNELLPIVQKHEQMARELPVFTETASR